MKRSWKYASIPSQHTSCIDNEQNLVQNEKKNF